MNARLNEPIAETRIEIVFNTGDADQTSSNPGTSRGEPGERTEPSGDQQFQETPGDDANLESVGCMMGRYSLDEPGLIYAHSGNEGFDHLHLIFPFQIGSFNLHMK